MTREHSHARPAGTGPQEQPTDESSTRRIVRQVGRLLALPLIGLIRFYQLVISPLTPPTCRYYPSCSAYAVTSLQRFGPIKGTWLAVRRLLRCHPWAPGGVDHVPERAHTASVGVPHVGAPSTPASAVPGPTSDAPGATGAPPVTRATSDFRSAERPTDPQG